MQGLIIQRTSGLVAADGAAAVGANRTFSRTDAFSRGHDRALAVLVTGHGRNNIYITGDLDRDPLILQGSKKPVLEFIILKSRNKADSEKIAAAESGHGDTAGNDGDVDAAQVRPEFLRQVETSHIGDTRCKTAVTDIMSRAQA